VVAFGTLMMKEKSSLKPSLHFIHLKIFRSRKILIENYYYKQGVTLQELEWHGRKAKKALVPAFLIKLYVVRRNDFSYTFERMQHKPFLTFQIVCL
jgi:hypothetical protein